MNFPPEFPPDDRDEALQWYHDKYWETGGIIADLCEKIRALRQEIASLRQSPQSPS